MARNKLPPTEKKVLLMSVYVHPSLNKKTTKEQVNNLINQLQKEALQKCADESLKSK